MMSARTAHIRLTLAAILALVMGCGDAHAPGSDHPSERLNVLHVLSALIVSNPAGVGGAPAATAESSGAAADAGIVYVSLPPGAFPAGSLCSSRSGVPARWQRPR